MKKIVKISINVKPRDMQSVQCTADKYILNIDFRHKKYYR